LSAFKGKTFKKISINVRAGQNNGFKSKYISRQQQVAVSRLRMGYSNVTHGYRIRDEMRPHCEDCNQEVTVEHLLFQCLVFNGLRQKYGINRGSLSDDREEAVKLIKYLKETGLFYHI
jgi:hypothetical protein